MPIRKLANENNISIAKTYRHIISEINNLPDNTWLTANYCNRWSGRLCLDGKYVKVKDYVKKIPFIYGIDYLTHDIPVGMLFPSENEKAFLKYFIYLKKCNYPLQILICDDNFPVKTALKRVYSKARIQLCQNHYLENIRTYLNVRTNTKYQSFFFDLQQTFNTEHYYLKREAMLRRIYYVYGKNDEIVQAILMDIAKRQKELFAFKFHISKCPNTNNIIESYNSHLQGRLKTIKGFQNFHSANRWLNAWMIRRRTKEFTDCNHNFKHLNGKSSLEMSIKKQAKWPTILGVKKHPK